LKSEFFNRGTGKISALYGEAHGNWEPPEYLPSAESSENKPVTC